MKIEELLVKDVKPEQRIKKPSICLSCSQILDLKKQKSKPTNFENEVFKNFCMNKGQLGIAKVYKLKNMLVDGVVELGNGT
ncbi:MAG: hypothetical protein P8181_12935, partial [bacterium]